MKKSIKSFSRGFQRIFCCFPMTLRALPDDSNQDNRDKFQSHFYRSEINKSA